MFRSEGIRELLVSGNRRSNGRGYRCENFGNGRVCRLSSKMLASDRQSKQLVDKLQLRRRVTFAHPSGSPLPNHVDRLDSL
jgi:hypothetical protein